MIVIVKVITTVNNVDATTTTDFDDDDNNFDDDDFDIFFRLRDNEKLTTTETNANVTTLTNNKTNEMRTLFVYHVRILSIFEACVLR